MGGGGLIFSKCPRCGSDRIRRGYRRAPIWWRIIGRYHLLCNACNWEFAGWAIPGTVEAAATRRRKKRAEEKRRQAAETVQESNESAANHKTTEDNLQTVEDKIQITEDNSEDNPETIEDDAEKHTRAKMRKRVRVRVKK